MVAKEDLIPPEDRDLFKEAWNISRTIHGESITFYLPGMVRIGRERGRYPAVSITGKRCELMCEHCRGLLLEPMIPSWGPEDLIKKCLRLSRSGAHGILLSGGSDPAGKLPWGRYYRAIAEIKEQTGFHISVHTGFPDQKTCDELRKAGVEQALIDVMGDSETSTRVYHLQGLKQVVGALESISRSGLGLVPHIVAGLYYGKMRAEHEALKIISHYKPSALVVVVLTPLQGTPMAHVSPPHPVDVARLIASARVLLPDTPISLGCERPRNYQGTILEKLAIMAGVNRMAVWSEEAVEKARSLGLKPRFQSTCCSVKFRDSFCVQNDKASPGQTPLPARSRY